MTDTWPIDRVADLLRRAFEEARGGYMFFAGAWFGRAGEAISDIRDDAQRERARQLCNAAHSVLYGMDHRRTARLETLEAEDIVRRQTRKRRPRKAASHAR